MPSTFVALDLETTGLEAERDVIIEIGCVKFRHGEIVAEWSTLVNPGRPIPFQITQLTGISNQDVAQAPPLEEVAGPLRHFVGSAPLVAHNISFDLGFLRAAGIRLPGPAIDTFELASIVLPSHSSYSLSSLAAHFGIVLEEAHRALDDARATGLLFQALCDYATSLPLSTLAEINRLAMHSNWSLRQVFQEAEQAAARHAFLRPRERQALQEGDLGPLLNPAALKQPVYADELVPAEKPEPLDVETLAAVLEPGGPLAAIFPGYEHREPQVAMLRAVAEAFNHGDHLLIEAGTGTGKSLAYLLPAIAWSLQNRRRVVISTNTINLQDQLITKDIPDLQRVFAAILEEEGKGDRGERAARARWNRFRQLAEQMGGLRVAVMKGRSNYLCPRRFDALRSRDDLSADELRVLARVLVWLSQTMTGDRSELFLLGSREEAVWARLATESGTCTPERCQRSQGGRCFFYRNRRQAEAAHLIVVNHALLLSDVAAANRVLPEYQHLIVDEAHHLEDATTKQLSFQASQEGLERLLRDLYPEGGEGRSGLLYDVQRRGGQGLPANARRKLEDYIVKAQQLVEDSRVSLAEFFTTLAAFVNAAEHKGPYSQRTRLKKLRLQPGWSRVEVAWEATGASLLQLTQVLDTLRRGLDELDQAGVTGLDDLSADLSSLTLRLSEVYEQLNAAIFEPDSGMVYWVEVGANNHQLSLHAAPLHIGPLVEEHLFYQKDNVILTSATLRTADSYEYIVERLHAFDARTTTVGSPFDYKSSTLVYIPTDVDDPNGPRFQRQVEMAVRELAKALHGRTLALFTSYNQLRRTADAIGPDLAAAGIAIHQQGGGGSRRQLLENFRTGAPSVLLGTRSFWEGIDVVGPALSGLIITRLPFAVPTDPIVAARAETFEDPFYQYSVPDAILRFRQGFGRLIRSRQDRGVCVIMDNRVLTRRYGRLFLDSLPDCTVRHGPLSLMANAARRWLEQPGQ